MRLKSEEIKARLEAVGVSEVDVSAPCLNCASACAPLLLFYHVLSPILFYLTCTCTLAFKCMCTCVHVCICSLGVEVRQYIVWCVFVHSTYTGQLQKYTSTNAL